jgi:hypothetical protein
MAALSGPIANRLDERPNEMVARCHHRRSVLVLFTTRCNRAGSGVLRPRPASCCLSLPVDSHVLWKFTLPVRQSGVN